MRNRTGFTPIGEVLGEALHGSYLSKSLATGFWNLDLCLGGLAPGELMIVGGRSEAGKTSFGLAVAQNAAFRKRRSVAFISLESQATELRQRMMSAESEVPIQAIKLKNLSRRHQARIDEARQRCTGAVLLLDDPARATVQEIHTRLARHKPAVELIVIDNIHLLDHSKYVVGYEEEMFTSLMRHLKILARDLNAVVVGISRFSQQAEHGRGTPGIESLMGSEAISSFSDSVLLLNRKGDSPAAGDVIDVSVVQNNKGPMETHTLAFLPDIVSLRQIAA
jgi:replicative DNA helicase